MQHNTDLPYSVVLLDAVGLFETLGIAYALAGGLAAMFYGRARFTDDVDFVAISNHQAILQANPEVMRGHKFDPACTYKLYHSSGVDVDLWKDEFADGITSRSIETQLAGRAVRIVEMHDLVAMKLRAGRFQDDYDISEIIRHQRLNRDTLSELVTPEQLRRFDEIEQRTNQQR